MELFLKMIELSSLKGLRPRGDGFFGCILKSVSGRPRWNDELHRRHSSEPYFTDTSARTALENVTLVLDGERLQKSGQSQATDLNIPIATHINGEQNTRASYSIKFKFEKQEDSFYQSGALFVSAGLQFNKTLLAVAEAFGNSNPNVPVFVSEFGKP